MEFQEIPISSLVVNKSNDRHGALEDEEAAISWLFENHDLHMRRLAQDIVKVGRIFEPPLVRKESGKFVVYDGNRRVTCLKLLSNPQKAPTEQLRNAFVALKDGWKGTFPTSINCQVESGRSEIDDILFRRHTGVQGGVGQSKWDDRMKLNFVERTGKASGAKIGKLVEDLLGKKGMLPKSSKIPFSTMDRLLSSETYRNRVGISLKGSQITFVGDEQIAIQALRRIAEDLAAKNVVLGDLWKKQGKDAYLDRLRDEGVIEGKQKETQSKKSDAADPKLSPQKRTTLIPGVNFNVQWKGATQKHREIWEELQFRLDLTKHRNAVAVLFRVLLELSAEHYISGAKLSVGPNDKFHQKLTEIAESLHSAGEIDNKYLAELRKLSQNEKVVSIDTLHRYVHSADFSASPDHLIAIWNSVSKLIVLCLNR